MNTFYLAGAYDKREFLREAASRIARYSGWTCNARWLFEDLSKFTPEEAAGMDLDDIRGANVFIITNTDSTSGGMWVELGYAMGIQMPIIYYKVIWSSEDKINIFAESFYKNKIEDINKLVEELKHLEMIIGR